MMSEIQYKDNEKYFIKFKDVVITDEDILLIGKTGYKGTPMTVDHIVYCIAENEDDNHVKSLTRSLAIAERALEMACGSLSLAMKIIRPFKVKHDIWKQMFADYIQQATAEVEGGGQDDE